MNLLTPIKLSMSDIYIYPTYIYMFKTNLKTKTASTINVEKTRNSNKMPKVLSLNKMFCFYFILLYF